MWLARVFGVCDATDESRMGAAEVGKGEKGKQRGDAYSTLRLNG